MLRHHNKIHTHKMKDGIQQAILEPLDPLRVQFLSATLKWWALKAGVGGGVGAVGLTSVCVGSQEMVEGVEGRDVQANWFGL